MTRGMVRPSLLLVASSVLLLSAAVLSAGATAGFVPGVPVPLPADPLKQCRQEAFQNFTAHNPRCAKKFWTYADPDVECCDGLATFFGVDSVRPSRNCWCDADTWDWMQTAGAKTYINWKAYALVCSRMGYIIGFHEMPDSASAGYCNGTAPSEDEINSALVEDHSRSPSGNRALKVWLQALNNNGLVASSVAFSIVSAIGLSAMLYPIFFELGMAAKESLQEWRRR